MPRETLSSQLKFNIWQENSGVVKNNLSLFMMLNDFDNDLAGILTYSHIVYI